MLGSASPWTSSVRPYGEVAAYAGPAPTPASWGRRTASRPSASADMWRRRRLGGWTRRLFRSDIRVPQCAVLPSDERRAAASRTPADAAPWFGRGGPTEYGTAGGPVDSGIGIRRPLFRRGDTHTWSQVAFFCRSA